MSKIAQVRTWLSQFSAWAFGATLTVGDYQPVIVVIRQPLNTTTTTNNDTFRVPEPYHFLVQRVRGHIGFKAFTSETLSITGIGNPSVLDRVAMKAQNCRVDFVNSDKKYNIIDNQQLVLASLLSDAGGQPAEFDPPLVVLAGQVLKATFTLTDTTAAIVGGNTEYGLILEGILVREDAG